MKLAILIALGPALCILTFACTELTKVFCSPWSHIRKELHFHTTQRLPYCNSQQLSNSYIGVIRNVEIIESKASFNAQQYTYIYIYTR